MNRRKRLVGALQIGAGYAVFFWCGWTLDHPRIAWWRHVLLALLAGLLISVFMYFRSEGPPRKSQGKDWPAWLRWVALIAWEAAAVGYAVYRNGPAQYVAAAILAGVPLAVLWWLWRLTSAPGGVQEQPLGVDEGEGVVD